MDLPSRINSAYPIVPATPTDYRRRAEKRLPRFLFDYIDGGANDEVTLAANIADFQSIRIRQRVLRDVSNVQTGATLWSRLQCRWRWPRSAWLG